MLELPDQPVAVVYTAPITQRILHWISGLLIGLLLIGVAPAATGAAAMALLGLRGPPLAAVLAGTVVAAALATGWAWRNNAVTRLILREQSFRIVGLLFWRTRRYEDISLLNLERPGGTVGRAAQVVIEFAHGGPVKVWLKRELAEECLGALHEFARKAAAVDLDGTVRGAADRQHVADGYLAAARKYQRRARGAMLGAMVFGALWLIGTGSVLIAPARLAGQPRYWGKLIFGAIVVGTWILAWRRLRQAARKLELMAADARMAAGSGGDPETGAAAAMHRPELLEPAAAPRWQ